MGAGRKTRRYYRRKHRRKAAAAVMAAPITDAQRETLAGLGSPGGRCGR